MDSDSSYYRIKKNSFELVYWKIGFIKVSHFY